MRRAPFAVACVLAIGVAIVSAQTPGQVFDAYSDIVRAYRLGDAAAATNAVLAWSERDLRRIAPFVVLSSDEKFPHAAVMLHTDIVMAASNMASVEMHLRFAETLVTSLPSARPSTAGFQQRWYALAASLFLHYSDPVGARPVIERGLRRFDRNPRLHVLLGIVNELTAHQLDPECSRPGCEARGARSGPAIAASLGEAEHDYRRALELDGTVLEARLRLGRILFLQNKRKAAREELEEVARSARDDSTAYLVHLFLGELDKDDGDLAAAAREYEAAMKIGPRYQTPYVALSFIEQMLGHTARAREILEVLAGPLFIQSDDDPWWGYEAGAVDLETLAWLRQDIR